LRSKLVEDFENPDEVDERGLGAVHHLVLGDHSNKLALLTCLVMGGMANIDLTTSEMDQVTALHLACKVRQY